jgi:multiple sugar transport system permease protein
MSTVVERPPARAATTPNNRRRTRRRKDEASAKAGPGWALLAWVLTLLFFTPVAWMVLTSLHREADAAPNPPSPLAPITFGNYGALFDRGVAPFLINSATASIVSTLLVLLLAVPAAYALVRLRTRLAKPVMAWVLVSQLFPFILVVVPIFLILRNIQLVDTRAGLVLIYVVWILPFALWMLQGYVRELTPEIEEAASIDGAGRLQVLRAIVFPLMLPGIIATTLFAFITSWNEFFFALVLIKSPELETLPLTLARFVGLEGVARLGPLAAGSLLATLPSLVFFSFIQRGLAGGLVAGATKG